MESSIAYTIPTTRPLLSSTGPPEFPGCTSAVSSGSADGHLGKPRRTSDSALERRENRVGRGQRRPVAPHVLPLDPLRLRWRLLAFPFADVPLDLAEHGRVLALVEVLEERADVSVVVERPLRGELEPAARRESNRLIAGFDYPQNRVFRLFQFGLTMRMEAAGIEPVRSRTGDVTN